MFVCFLKNRAWHLLFEKLLADTGLKITGPGDLKIQFRMSFSSSKILKSGFQKGQGSERGGGFACTFWGETCDSKNKCHIYFLKSAFTLKTQKQFLFFKEQEFS